jgi:hypothetical protein
MRFNSRSGPRICGVRDQTVAVDEVWHHFRSRAEGEKVEYEEAEPTEDAQGDVQTSIHPATARTILSKGWLRRHSTVATSKSSGDAIPARWQQQVSVFWILL